jgi:hypothetical protein
MRHQQPPDRPQQLPALAAAVALDHPVEQFGDIVVLLFQRVEDVAVAGGAFVADQGLRHPFPGLLQFVDHTHRKTFRSSCPGNAMVDGPVPLAGFRRRPIGL